MFFTLLQIVREGEANWTGKRTSQVSRWLLAAQMFDYLTSKTKSVRIAHFSFTNFPVFSIKLINFLIKDFSFIIGIYFTAIFVGGKFKFLFLVGNSKFTTCWTHVQQHTPPKGHPSGGSFYHYQSHHSAHSQSKILRARGWTTSNLP